MKIGVLGYGAIGKKVVEYLMDKYLNKIYKLYIFDKDYSKIESAKKLNPVIEGVESINDLVEKSKFIVESASIQAAKEIINLGLNAGRDLLIMSVGALIDDYQNYFQLAYKNKSRLIIPSGAIAGMDAVKALSKTNIKEICLSTYKPILSLANAPYMRENNIKIEDFKGMKLIFEGNVKEAVRAFPQNINVAACLQLSSLFPEIKIRIFGCEEMDFNRHEIELKTDIGNYKFICENFSSPDNPKTSHLAIYSALSCIDGYFNQYLRIGN